MAAHPPEHHQQQYAVAPSALYPASTHTPPSDAGSSSGLGGLKTNGSANGSDDSGSHQSPSILDGWLEFMRS